MGALRAFVAAPVKPPEMSCRDVRQNRFEQIYSVAGGKNGENHAATKRCAPLDRTLLVCIYSPICFVQVLLSFVLCLFVFLFFSVSHQLQS